MGSTSWKPEPASNSSRAWWSGKPSASRFAQDSPGSRVAEKFVSASAPTQEFVTPGEATCGASSGMPQMTLGGEIQVEGAERLAVPSTVTRKLFVGESDCVVMTGPAAPSL